MTALTRARQTAGRTLTSIWSSWRIVLLAIFVGVLAATLLAGPVQRYRDSQARVDWLRQQIAAVEDDHTAATEQLRQATSPAGMERAIRERLGWVHPDDTVLLRDRPRQLTIPPRPPDPSGGP